MAFTLKLKNSVTQDRLPNIGGADFGELFVNAHTASAQLQIKTTNGGATEMRVVGGIISRATAPPNALNGTTWWDSANKVLKLRDAGAWVDLSDPVNLAEGNPTATTVDVTNTGGADATLTAATDVRAGLMTAADKSKLDAYPNTPAAGADLGYTASPTDGTVTNTGGADATVPVADTTNAGLMSPGDKQKLDNYPASLPPATTHDLTYSAGPTEGVVEITGGTDATIPLVDSTNAGLMAPADKDKLDTAPADIQQAIDDAQAAATPNLGYTAAATDGTVTNSAGNDATLPLVDTTNAGLMSPGDKTKLDGVGAGAEVNVQADWKEADPTSDAFIQNKPGVIASIDDLTDVDTTTVPPNPFQVLYWNGFSSQWEPGDYLALSGGNMTGSVTATVRTITAGGFDLSTSNLFAVGSIAVPRPTNIVVGMTGVIGLNAAPTSWDGIFKHPGGTTIAPTAFPAVVPFFVASPTQILLGKPVEGIV